MKLKLFLLLQLFSLTVFAQSHELSPNAEISVLTFGPGKNLNDAFGHSAFRVKDQSVGMDVVYGYGEYDFDTPNFYLKFAQGKLNYQMSKHDFVDIYRYYSYFNRTIEEQVLNLSAAEKQSFYNYLVENYQPENRKYLYDFFYDNCATRIRDVAEASIDGEIKFTPSKDFKAKTFRELIHDQVGLNTWGSFGIDIALGSVIDKQATPYEHMFLPKYIHQFFGNATLESDKKLVKDSKVIFKSAEKPNSSNFLWSPLMIMGIVSIIILFITYKDHQKQKRSKWVDLLLFGITGLIGIAILLLWFATDHTGTAQNYNVLWAFPLNLFIIGQLLSKRVRNWFRNYLKFLIIMLVLLCFHWIMNIQVYAVGLIPFLIALLIRYVFLLKHFKDTQEVY
ncbi:DUF4105 domain-containing protein [Subsaxibacter sp. CAU 1640]|uniref:lipoprotein N-acyltransferase Lnb domain-containing protein n=1 Tax=Subsaxibacter sp. CAU 1640 TaxID=2933271 RepID=UPI0020053F55|nr:DUF4105 domain-containing protein [Subsaxibacter sp. CAU 1640]MCK7589879.1 DUF4105 domain-containing protein [Subsaxibacter sp. CAU 1640]